MAMMISKFNKLIRSRLLWGGFLIVIVFSFVVWGMVWPSDLDEMERINAAGMLDGEPVPHGEFRSAYLSTYLARALALGRDVASTPESEAALRQLSWQRLATLREAAKLGISATEEELVLAIRANFSDENRRYSPQHYQAFLQNAIRPMGFSPAQFEQHVREEIVMRKLGEMIGRQAHVTPLEVRRTFETLLDSFTVQYVAIAVDDVRGGVNVDETAARAYFDANPAAFTLPEKREILYAAFPVERFFDADADVSDADVMDYSDLHVDRFTTVEVGEDGQERSAVADLADVREEIVALVRREAALVKADSAAAELAFRAIPGRDGALPDFAAEAQKAGVEAIALPPFSRFESPLDDVGASFVAAVFELEENAFDRVGAPVAGTDHVYVAYLSKIHPPRLPDYDEVAERALEAARNKAIFDALSAKIAAVRADAAAGLARGQSFSDSIAAHGLSVVSPEPFTGLSGASSEDEAIQALVQHVVAYNPGEIADPVPTARGAIVAYVAARTPADPALFDEYRDEIASVVRNRRAQSLFMDWQAALLAPGRFVDLQRQAPADDLDDEEDI